MDNEKNDAVGKMIVFGIVVLFVVMLVVAAIPSPEWRSTNEAVNQMADKLSKMTTPTGTYERHDNEDLGAIDAWSTPLKAEYSNGLVMEELVVRSAGEDKKFNTHDDITASRRKASLKGAGNAIKNGVGETAKNTSKGIIEGIKEAFKGKEEDKKEKNK